MGLIKSRQRFTDRLRLRKIIDKNEWWKWFYLIWDNILAI